tara:strand:+ start:152 stop:613 length:462 start_codon:yes stop_codon:yes gene_type:complete
VSTLQVDNPESNTWVNNKTSLSSRAKASGVSVGDFFFLAGGVNDSIVFGDFWRYSLQYNEWEKLDSIPFEPRFDMIAFEANGRAYFGLGQDTTEFYNDLWSYDIISQKWNRLDDFPGSARTYTCALKTLIGAMIACGNNDQGAVLDEVYMEFV